MSDLVRAVVVVAPRRYEVQEFQRPGLDDGALLMHPSTGYGPALRLPERYADRSRSTRW